MSRPIGRRTPPPVEPASLDNKPYVAIFLDRDSRVALLSWWGSAVGLPFLPKLHADHVTLVYNPTIEEQMKMPLGQHRVVIVTGWAADDAAQAVLVTGAFSSKNKHPHITMATGDASAVYSNELLAKGYVPVVGPLLRGSVEVRWD